MEAARAGMSKWLGFDQSSNHTGFAIFKSDKLQRYGLIDKSKNKDVPLRIKDMFLSIADLIQEEQPDYLVFEGVQRQANEKTMLMLSQLGGMCIGYAYEHSIEVCCPLPVEWRAKLGFRQGAHVKREELKEQAKTFTKVTFGVEASEDECEAIALTYAMLL